MYTKYKIVRRSRSVAIDYMIGLAKSEAYAICERMNWQFIDPNKFVWDLEIELERC